jgi:drug/metabolite transporter (DMT)-like permease
VSQEPSPAPASVPLRGIICMLVSIVLLTVSDAIAKWLTVGYPPGQIICLRGVFVVLVILAFTAPRRRRTGLRLHNPRAHLVRAIFAAAATFLFVLGLTFMPLADAMAITFAGPLIITALAGPLLGEQVGWRRWSAVLVGFGGVVVMLRPGSGTLEWAALLLLLSTLCGGMRDIVTRRISVTESSTSMLLTTNLLLVAVGLLSIIQGWAMPTLFDAGLILLSGVLIGSGHWLQIEAFRWGQAATVVPFRYTTLLWAMLLGFLIWGDVPDAWMLGGASLVVASGLYILYREQRPGRPPPRPVSVRIPGHRGDDTQ